MTSESRWKLMSQNSGRRLDAVLDDMQTGRVDLVPFLPSVSVLTNVDPMPFVMAILCHTYVA